MKNTPVPLPALPPDAPWRCFTDTVMGGLSTATLQRQTQAGRDAWVLRGRVRTENGGGFVQMALDVDPPPAAARGIELDLAGAGHDLGVHLRTTRLVAPWQAWRARVTPASDWCTVRLAWTASRRIASAAVWSPARSCASASSRWPSTAGPTTPRWRWRGWPGGDERR